MMQALFAACEWCRDADANAPYEHALRDLLPGDPERFGYEDITGLPWIEIDYPEDVERAGNEIEPRLVAASAVS